MRLSLIAFLFPLLGLAQDTIPHTFLTNISGTLNENSGLAYIQGQLWTFEDGGGAAALYQLDTLTGAILRSVSISNASNVDWEDITVDSNYVYIGDFGNNNGNRTNQRVYRVALDSLIMPANSMLYAEVIEFSFADQVDFSSTPEATVFDCEAMIADEDSLYLFTKRWTDEWTKQYSLPKIPGIHQAIPGDSIPVGGLVTAADMASNGSLFLCGYRFALNTEAFVLVVDSFASLGLEEGTSTKFAFGESLVQIEGLAMIDSISGFISAENFLLNPPRLWKFQRDLSAAIPKQQELQFALQLTPNGFVVVHKAAEYFEFEFFSVNGRLLQRGSGFTNTNISFSWTTLPPLSLLKLRSSDSGTQGIFKVSNPIR